jgi:hypothetical protein
MKDRAQIFGAAVDGISGEEHSSMAIVIAIDTLSNIS